MQTTEKCLTILFRLTKKKLLKLKKEIFISKLLDVLKIKKLEYDTFNGLLCKIIPHKKLFSTFYD